MEEGQKTLQYLEMFIGNMSNIMLDRFLRFVTGSSVCIGKSITVNYNRLTSKAQRLSVACLDSF